MDEDTIPPNRARSVGFLGMVGGWLAEAEQALSAAGRGADAARARDRARAVAAFLRQMMEDADAGEGDPHAS